MKKITIAFCLLFLVGVGAQAQDLKKAKTLFQLSQFPGAGAPKLEEAKIEVDKLATDPKVSGKAEALLLRSQLYGIIAGNAALSEKYPEAANESLIALKKYLEAEPEAKKIKDENFVGLNDIYKVFFDQGVKEYNTKNWDKSYTSFQHLVELSDLMISRKWSGAAFDTTGYLYAGITAQNSKKDDEAVKYYSKLADMKLKGNDYQHIYVFLPQYYATQKKDAEFKKYMAISKEVYPEKTFWGDIEFEYTTNSLGLDDLTKKFDDDDAAKTLSAGQYFDFGNYFVNDKKIKELDDAGKLKYKQKAIYAFTKAAQMDTLNTLAFFNAGVTTYSAYEDAAETARLIKGTTAEVKTRRAAADKVADAAANKSIEWLEKAYSKLDAKTEKDKVEKNSQSTSAKFLSNLYEYKREHSKGNDALYDKYDKKFKFYDTKY